MGSNPTAGTATVHLDGSRSPFHRCARLTMDGTQGQVGPTEGVARIQSATQRLNSYNLSRISHTPAAVNQVWRCYAAPYLVVAERARQGSPAT